jgi:hypothetical protein
MMDVIRGNGREAPVIVSKRDGPMVVFSDGRVHWLTLAERAQEQLGLTNAWRLQGKYRPDLAHIATAEQLDQGGQ